MNEGHTSLLPPPISRDRAEEAINLATAGGNPVSRVAFRLTPCEV